MGTVQVQNGPLVINIWVMQIADPRERFVIHLPLSHALWRSEAKETEYIGYAYNRGSLTG